MRVTGNQLVENASANVDAAQTRAGEAADHASEGLQVATPSDNPVAWAIAQRASDRLTESQGRATVINTATDNLQAASSALSSLNTIISSARAVAVQGSSDSNSAATRATLAIKVQNLFQSAISAANAQNGDGEYVLAGSNSTTQPFDSTTGAYIGNAGVRSAQIAENNVQAVSVNGSTLTAAGGGANAIDVIPALQTLATALANNDTVGIQNALGTLTQAGTQITVAQSQAGDALASLNTANTARTSFETSLQATVSNAIDGDAVAQATALANASTALDAAQTVAARVIQLVKVPGS